MPLPVTKKFTFLILAFFATSFSSQLLAQDFSEESNILEFNFEEDYQGDSADFLQEDSLIHDPLERINRTTFAFNEAFDRTLLLPTTRQYRRFIPNIIRQSIHNFLSNLSAPFSIANSILQGNGQNSMASFSSFLINSTVGIGGLFDVAGARDIEYNEEDLGQTLGKYGLGTGPYLVVPFLGPSNLRDFSGFTTELMLNPFTVGHFDNGLEDIINDRISISITALSVIDTREGLIEVIDNMRKNSFDTYATMRSAYLQRRQSLILNQ
ncbi:MAG: phospholipid-binding lipoprotein MlaA [Rickettsiales bacterium]|jgi:phospholipid-binding lipoprotein MlaA